MAVASSQRLGQALDMQHLYIQVAVPLVTPFLLVALRISTTQLQGMFGSLLYCSSMAYSGHGADPYPCNLFSEQCTQADA